MYWKLLPDARLNQKQQASDNEEQRAHPVDEAGAVRSNREDEDDSKPDRRDTEESAHRLSEIEAVDTERAKEEPEHVSEEHGLLLV